MTELPIIARIGTRKATFKKSSSDQKITQGSKKIIPPSEVTVPHVPVMDPSINVLNVLDALIMATHFRVNTLESQGALTFAKLCKRELHFPSRSIGFFT